MAATTQLFLNDHLVTISAAPSIIEKLNHDDRYLADYINRAAKIGQFNFLFAKDPSLRRIVVKRVATTFKPVWYRKGRPSEDDTAANFLLLKLRNSEKFSPRFKNGLSDKTQLWEELATEMRMMSGFDVDGQKCSQKFLQLVQKGETMEFLAEMKRLKGETSEEEDEDWLPPSMKRKRKKGEDEDFLKKFLKRKSERKQEQFEEMRALIRRRNELSELKLKQNREIVTLLGRLAKK